MHSISTKQRLYPFCALAVILLLVVTRQPQILADPRFWFEEGYVYYAYALEHNWLDTLFAPHQGYFSLLDNLVTLVASRAVSLKYAPFFTVYTALIIDMLPYVVVWFGRSRYWPTIGQKIPVTLAILFTGQICEIYLNIINCQFYLCLTSFLLLMEEWDHRSRRWRYFTMATLAVAALTGVVSCFLTPFFLYKAWRGRSWRPGYAILMCLACLFHAGILVWLSVHGELTHRFYHFHFLRLFGKLTSDLFNGLFPLISTDLQRRQYFWLAAALLVAPLYYFSRALSRYDQIMFAGTFVLLTLLSTLTSYDSDGGMRYNYAGSVIFMLMVLQNITRYRHDARHRMRVLLALFFFAGSLYTSIYTYYLNSCDRRDMRYWNDVPPEQLRAPPSAEEYQ